MSATTTTPATPSVRQREDFFAAQARHRASARLWAMAMAVVVAAIATTISALLAPLAFVVIGLVVDLFNLVVPMPDLLGRIGRVVGGVLNDLDNGVPAGLAVRLVTVAAIPGLIALAIVWRRLGRIFGAHHVEALQAELGLRAPDPLDFEEQQLQNLVEEMAIAAGGAPPRVLILDSEACNIGLLGDGADAALIVTRSLLDRLGRAPTQALIGQAIASLGDGDGLLAQRLLRLNAVLGLLMLLAQAPLSPPARTALRPLLRWRRRGGEAGDIQILKDVLTDPLAFGSEAGGASAERTWRDWVLMPLMGSVMIGIVLVPVATMLFVAPLSAVLWRRRRLLGDAMAVQFTRDPQALAEAYAALAPLPTGFGLQRNWLGQLFALDTGVRSTFQIGSPYPDPATRVERLNAMGARVAPPLAARRVPEWAWFVIVPLGGVLVVLFGALITLGVFLSVSLNGMFLALPATLLHTVLRHFGYG